MPSPFGTFCRSIELIGIAIAGTLALVNIWATHRGGSHPTG